MTDDQFNDVVKYIDSKGYKNFIMIAGESFEKYITCSSINDTDDDDITLSLIGNLVKDMSSEFTKRGVTQESLDCVMDYLIEMFSKGIEEHQETKFKGVN